MKIIHVRTAAQINEIRKLFREYEKFLCIDLSFENFEEEIAELPGKYAPPDGTIILAMDGKQAVGCVALRKIEDGVCEMKRLFVRENHRGIGLGRKLAVSIINEAKEIGYSYMRLDTLETLKDAIRLYNSLGFRNIEPYYHNPLPGVIYLELDLKNSSMV
jgi:ribosomal protein S18 acetylase RimI-like enzyme